MMQPLEIAMPANGLMRNAMRMAAYWLAGTLLLWAGDANIASASWAAKLAYLVIGSNCIFLFAGIANLTPRASPLDMTRSHLVVALNTTVLTALEVLAMLFVVITTGKILA